MLKFFYFSPPDLFDTQNAVGIVLSIACLHGQFFSERCRGGKGYAILP
jgi:hypothetical protein